MRLVWRGAVVVALLGLALGISWLPWRDLGELKTIWADDPKPTPPSISEPAVPPGDEAQASTPGPPAPGIPVPQPNAADKAAVATVIGRMNTERAKAGCKPVKEDQRLAAVASAHSAEMAQRGYFSHDGADGSDPWKRAAAAGYPKPLSENIAQGHQSADAVMDGWLASPGHRANIVNCAAQSVGIGLAHARNGTTYWTQLLGAL
jgi:uncharacterized protein YkwD